MAFRERNALSPSIHWIKSRWARLVIREVEIFGGFRIILAFEYFANCGSCHHGSIPMSTIIAMIFVHCVGGVCLIANEFYGTTVEM